MFHTGHLAMLNGAQGMGDYMLVCIDSDDRVRKLKGPLRPIYNQYERRLIVSNIKSVDRVEIFDSDEDLINILRDYKPDIMVKGSDWRGKDIIGAKYCGKVEFYDRINECSSTNIIQRISNRRLMHR